MSEIPSAGCQCYKMIIEIEFTNQPIPSQSHHANAGAGAVLEFHGIVREFEQGAKISALVYELYEPMAEAVIRRILETLGETHPCLSVHVIHRHGTVPVGEASIHVRVESKHRGEGLRLLEEFMNQLKADVPIWKTGSLPC